MYCYTVASEAMSPVTNSGSPSGFFKYSQLQFPLFPTGSASEQPASLSSWDSSGMPGFTGPNLSGGNHIDDYH